MSKLKLGMIEDDKPVKLTIEFPAAVHRNLVAYAEAIGRQGGHQPPEQTKIVALMVERFMATDRAYIKFQKTKAAQ
jgi:hypothetical protein